MIMYKFKQFFLFDILVVLIGVGCRYLLDINGGSAMLGIQDMYTIFLVSVAITTIFLRHYHLIRAKKISLKQLTPKISRRVYIVNLIIIWSAFVSALYPSFMFVSFFWQTKKNFNIDEVKQLLLVILGMSIYFIWNFVSFFKAYNSDKLGVSHSSQAAVWLLFQFIPAIVFLLLLPGNLSDTYGLIVGTPLIFIFAPVNFLVGLICFIIVKVKSSSKN